MNANPKLVSTPEAIALAATLIAQTKGDVSQARRSCTEALAWLQTVDPSFKPESAAAADPEAIAHLKATLSQVLDNADTVSATNAKTLADRDYQIKNLQHDLATCMESLGKLQSERDRLDRANRMLRSSADPDTTASPAPAPAVKTAPAPAAAAVQAMSPAPAGLPPSMAAWLANRAKLEID